MILIGEGTRIRRLTPVECERLQGFPDSWMKEGLHRWEYCRSVGHKEVQSTRECVTVNVIEFLVRGFLRNYDSNDNFRQF
jgi:site-specific DNA-cytosine methylase